MRKIFYGIVIPLMFLGIIGMQDSFALYLSPEQHQIILEEGTPFFYFILLFISLIIAIPTLICFLFYQKRKKNIQKINKTTIQKMNFKYDNKGKLLSSNENNSNKKRLKPSKEIVQKLLINSGNKCNFHPCSNTIVDFDGLLGGNLISIVSNEKEQTHYNSHLSSDDRIKIDNLMIVCNDHLFEIKINQNYTIERIIQKKINALESPNKDNIEIDEKIIEQLIHGYLKRYPSSL